MVCLCCTISSQPGLPLGALCALNHIAELCSDEIYQGYFLAAFVKEDVVQVEKCIKFLEYLWKAKCDPVKGWMIDPYFLAWDTEVLKALHNYEK